MSLPTKLKALSSHYDWRHPPSWWSSPCKNNFIFPPLPLIIRLAALAQYLIFKVNLDLTIHHQSWEDHLGINCKNTKYTRPRWTDTKLSWCDKFGRTRTILNMKTFKFYNKESSICDSSTQSELKHFVMRVGDWNINSFSLFLSLKAAIMREQAHLLSVRQSLRPSLSIFIRGFQFDLFTIEMKTFCE